MGGRETAGISSECRANQARGTRPGTASALAVGTKVQVCVKHFNKACYTLTSLVSFYQAPPILTTPNNISHFPFTMATSPLFFLVVLPIFFL